MQFFDFDFEDVINSTGFCPTKLDIYQDGKEYNALIKVIEQHSFERVVSGDIGQTSKSSNASWIIKFVLQSISE